MMMSKPMSQPLVLVYDEWLPSANAMLRMSGWRLKQHVKRQAINTFGTNPFPLKTRGVVHITRVLGPRQRFMDQDNLRLIMKPLVDALVTCGYLVNDNEVWADISYRQDETRREIGPRIELEITYPEV